MRAKTNDYYSPDKTPNYTLSSAEITRRILGLLRGISKTPAGTYRAHLSVNGLKTSTTFSETLGDAWASAAKFYEVHGNSKKAVALRWAALVVAEDANADADATLDATCKDMLGLIFGMPPEDCDEALLEDLRNALRDHINSHPPLNTPPHQPAQRSADRAPKALHEVGPRELECSLCGTAYTYPRLVGRPPAYCSSECRSEVARITTKAWRVANGLS